MKTDFRLICRMKYVVAVLLTVSSVFVRGEESGSGWLAEGGVAVFYSNDFVEGKASPSIALIKKLSKQSELPAAWSLRPSWSTVTGKYKSFKKLNNDGSIPPRYRASFINQIGDSDLYGTGEQKGKLRRNGAVVPLYNTDNFGHRGNRLYQSHPWVMGVRKDGSSFGIIADTTARGEICLKNNSITFDFEVAPYRVIVIERKSPQLLMKALADLTGKIAMPPRWALGYQQCRFSYMNETEGRDIIDNFRKRKLPCDVIWFDIDYMDGYRVFTFNDKAFPNPKRMNDYAHKNDFHTVWMIDPGVKIDDGYSVYDTMKDKELYVLKNKSGLLESDNKGMVVEAKATSSSVHKKHRNYFPKNAIDGNKNTLWCSENTKGLEWLQIDLGAVSEILNVGILWSDGYYASKYEIMHSNNGQDWASFAGVKSQTKGGFVKVPGLKQTQARYLKINCLKLGKKIRYEIKDVKVNGEFINPGAADIPEDMFGGKVWPGMCAFPDYTSDKTAKWWASLFKDYMAQGIDGVWNDMNEPAIFGGGALMTMNDSAYHRGGLEIATGTLPPAEHTVYHNAYGMLMAKATREGIMAAKPDKRPFVLTRANYLGGHRYAATWTGDNSSTEAHLKMSTPMCLNLGLSGQPFVGPDLGGFAGNCTPELFAKWIGVGAFYPFMRGHSTKGVNRKEPWTFGKETEDASRIALNRRYRLMPYIYTLFRESSVSGLPVIQPLFFADPKDTSLRNEEDIFLFGSDLMVMPSWASKAALPKGTWRPISLVDGDKDNKYQPELRLRPGAILPVGKVVQSTMENSLDPLTLYINLDANGTAMGTLYEDAGDGYGYKKGEFLQTVYSAVKTGNSIVVSIKSEDGKMARPKRSVNVILVTGKGVVKSSGNELDGVIINLTSD